MTIKNDFMISLLKGYVTKLRFKCETLGFAVCYRLCYGTWLSEKDDKELKYLIILGKCGINNKFIRNYFYDYFFSDYYYFLYFLSSNKEKYDLPFLKHPVWSRLILK